MAHSKKILVLLLMAGLMLLSSCFQQQTISAAAPVFSPSTSQNPFPGQISVSLTTTTSGADIYYTVNEAFPEDDLSQATLYTAPFPISSNSYIRAMTVDDELLSSNIVTAAYTFTSNQGDCVDNDGDLRGTGCTPGNDCNDSDDTVWFEMSCEYDGTTCGTHNLCVGPIGCPQIDCTKPSCASQSVCSGQNGCDPLCGTGQHCVGSTCVNDMECTTNSDCVDDNGAGWECNTTTGTCYDNSGSGIGDDKIFDTDVWVEAEDGKLSGSMTTKLEDGLTVVYSPESYEFGVDSASKGNVAYTFDVPTTDDYILKVMVKAIEGDKDSFFVVESTDTIKNPYNVYDVARSTTFIDDVVSLRGDTGTFSEAEYDPAVWHLTAGNHTIEFHARESNTLLDEVRLEKFQGNPSSCTTAQCVDDNGAGWECVDGACVPPNSCTGPSYSQIDDGVKEEVTGISSGDSFSHEDYCDSQGKLHQYYCTDTNDLGYGYYDLSECPNGGTCVDGACVPSSVPPNSCTGPDEGANDPLVKESIAGVHNGDSYELFDECGNLGEQILLRHCTDTNSQGYSYFDCASLGSSYICVDGVCVADPACTSSLIGGDGCTDSVSSKDKGIPDGDAWCADNSAHGFCVQCGYDRIWDGQNCVEDTSCSNWHDCQGSTPYCVHGNCEDTCTPAGASCDYMTAQQVEINNGVCYDGTCVADPVCTSSSVGGDGCTDSVSSGEVGISNGNAWCADTAGSKYGFCVRCEDGYSWDGQTDCVKTTVNEPPVAIYDTNPRGILQTGQSVTFISTSTDPNGDDTIVEHKWVINGETKYGKQVTKTFNAPNTYSFTLTVKDDKGATDTTSNVIVVEEISSEPKLWLGHYSGVLSRCDSSGSCESMGDKGSSILSLAVFDGSLWLGHLGGLLSRCSDSGSCDPMGNKGSGIYSMAVFDGKLWLGQYNGLSSCDSSGYCGDTFLPGIVDSLNVFDGSLWVGRDISGYLYSCDSSGGCSLKYTVGDSIYSMAFFDGKLWLGDYNGYLYSCDSIGSCDPMGKIGDSIRSMAVFDGSLWLGHYGGELSRCNTDGSCSSITEVKNDVPQDILSLAVFDGKLWLGHRGGLLTSYSANGDYKREYFFNSGEDILSLAVYPEE